MMGFMAANWRGKPMRFPRLLLLCVSCLGCGFSAVTGNGEVVEERREVLGFERISNDSTLEVNVTSGASLAVVLTGESNLLPHIRTVQVGDALVIENTREFTLHSPLTAQIVMPSFRGATHSGSGSLDVSGFTGRPELRLRVTGSGALRFEGSAGAVLASVEGSGPLTLIGDGDSLSAEASGSGTLNAEGLTVAAAELTASGSGAITARVNGDASFTNSGSGQIRATVNSGTVRCVVKGPGSVMWTGTASAGSTTVSGSGVCRGP
jgi:hypothetical protein